METMRSEFKATRETSTLSLGNAPTRITQGESQMVFPTMKSSQDVVSDAHGQRCGSCVNMVKKTVG